METVFAKTEQTIVLPQPQKSGKTSLEQTLQQRRSIREYSPKALSLVELGQLLWAAQGVNRNEGYRTVPSAGALYPLELYVLAGDVKGLTPGVYHYRAHGHRLMLVGTGDRRNALAHAALGQGPVGQAAAVVAVCAVYARSARKYGKRGERYVHIEAGHAAQNLLLQVEALGLASVVVGAFDDDEVARVLHLPSDVEPVLLLPVGHRK